MTELRRKSMKVIKRKKEETQCQESIKNCVLPADTETDVVISSDINKMVCLSPINASCYHHYRLFGFRCDLLRLFTCL